MKLVLLTTFGTFSPSYSLCSVVFDQARAALYNGDEVSLWTVTGNPGENLPPDIEQAVIDGRLKIRSILPKWTWKHDDINEEILPEVIRILERGLAEEGPCIVIAHDLIFQDTLLTYAKALHAMITPQECTIYHMCHSAPGLMSLTDQRKWRSSLPDKHFLLCLNFAITAPLAAYYQTTTDRVRFIPNARDLTYLLGMDDFTRNLIYDTGLLEADIVQIYPLSFTRARDKGIHHLFQIFHELNLLGLDARLLFVDADATGLDAIHARDWSREMISLFDMEGKVAFVSDRLRGGRAKGEGLSNQQVNWLFQISNLFIFPTVSEMCPLIQLEAAAAGCLLVLNAQVPGCVDINPVDQTLYFSFGHVHDRTPAVDHPNIARRIVETLDQSPANRTKRNVLRYYSIPAVAEYLKALGISRTETYEIIPR